MARRTERYVSMDPGTKNFAVALLDDSGKCLYVSMFRHTIRSMAQKDREQRVEFRRRMGRLLDRLKPTRLMAETFTVRGFGTNSIELIGIMLGSIMVLADERGIEEQTTMSSTWKQNLKKRHDLDRMYDDARELGVPPHVVDAILIGQYLRLDRDFAKFSPRQHAANVRFASRTLRPEDLIKPKRKVKHAVSRR